MKKKALIIFLVVIIVALLAGGYWFWWRERPGQEASPVPEVGTPETAPARYTITGLKIPHQVDFYNGIIREVGEGYIIIEANPSNNYLTSATMFKVQIDEKTHIIRYYITPTVGIGGSPQITPDAAGGLGKLQVGQTVMVHSRGKIQGSKEATFSADKVVVMGL